MPSHSPTIGFRLPTHDYSDLLNLCQEGESAAACAKRLLLDMLHNGEVDLTAPKRELMERDELGAGWRRQGLPNKGAGVQREKAVD